MKRVWRPDWPIDVDLVLGPLSRGARDPVARRTARRTWWLTGRTASGPATVQVDGRLDGAVGRVEAEAWGPGAEELLDRIPVLLGDGDDPTGFDPPPATVVAQQWRLHGSRWRVPCTGLPWEAVLPAVLEQKVTGQEARRSWYRLCAEYGQPAPGPAPAGMRLVPDRDSVAGIPSWWWRGAGVDHARASTLRQLARIGLDDPDPGAVRARMSAVPGIGPWTIAEVALRALGDADAVSVGDFHLANAVGYALTGAPRSTDPQMLDLLAGFAPHRYRAIRMIQLAGVRPPKYGPRTRLPTHR